MKQIILNTPETNVVSLNDTVLSERKFYGVLIDGQLGFITRQKYKGREYIVVSSDTELTEGNGWSNYSGGNLKQVISGVLGNGYEVFEFTSAKEFWTWVAENCED